MTKHYNNCYALHTEKANATSVFHFYYQLEVAVLCAYWGFPAILWNNIWLVLQWSLQYILLNQHQCCTALSLTYRFSFQNNQMIPATVYSDSDLVESTAQLTSSSSHGWQHGQPQSLWYEQLYSWLPSLFLLLVLSLILPSPPLLSSPPHPCPPLPPLILTPLNPPLLAKPNVYLLPIHT